MMRCVLTALLILIARPTDACNLPHHGTAHLTKIDSHITVQTDYADFALGSHTGSWNSLTLQGEYAVLDWLAISARLPIARITLDGQDSSFGVADMDAGIRTRILQTESGAIQWGMGVNVIAPTGDPDDGLGSGHAAVAGHTSLGVRLATPVFLNVLIQYAASLKSDDHGHQHDHDPGDGAVGGSLVAPHGDQEFSGIAGLIITTDFGYVGVDAEVIYGLKEPQGMGPINAHLNLGVDLAPHWELQANLSFPLTDETRYLWRTSVGLRWTFGSHETVKTVEGGCGCGKPAP